MEEIKDNGIITEHHENGDKSKRKVREAKKTPFLIGGILALLAFFWIVFALLSGEESVENKSVVKTKEALAQEQKILSRNAQKQKAFDGIRDELLENPDVTEEVQRSSENEKYGDLLQYLKTDPERLVSENVIGQEEYRPDPRESLSSSVNYESAVTNRDRGIYRGGTDLDPKYQKEDYEADKQSFFVYSTSYKGALYYAGSQAPAEINARLAPAATRQSKGDAEEPDEFTGKSEAQIAKILTDRYTQQAMGMMGGGQENTTQRNKTDLALTPVPIIYNNLAPVKCFQGQNLDCVLLHKLIADTEEAPVVVAVSKDFFDATAKYVVIPSGTRVIGRSQVINYNGAARLYVWFDRIILPNGISVPLPQSGSGLDVQGALGIVSNVNRHFWQKYSSAIFVGLLDGLSGLAQSNTSDAQMQYMFGRTSENFGEVNKEIMRFNGNIVPTISVNSGHKIKINLSADIIISAFSLISERSYARRGGINDK